uniref:ATP synthase F0 subunit 8 n=1 Tax=Paratomella rubra TaxID=90914 RepID=A0A1X9WD75_PARRR|nr:ATP synthase F0 subunit 8 [Paratomella rubra]ARS00880.1 ATP synthase F0 subunit 8 [Paratomella rubra]
MNIFFSVFFIVSLVVLSSFHILIFSSFKEVYSFSMNLPTFFSICFQKWESSMADSLNWL